jgi:signal transduction histidine kinase
MASVAQPAGRLTYEEVEHELKTPLTTIRSVSEILRDCPELSPEERRQFLSVLLDENARLTGAVNRLLGHPVMQEVLS